MKTSYLSAVLLILALFSSCSKKEYGAVSGTHDNKTMYCVFHEEGRSNTDRLVFALGYPFEFADGRNSISIYGDGYFHLGDTKVDYRKDGDMVYVNGSGYDLKEGRVLLVSKIDTGLQVKQEVPDEELNSRLIALTR